MVISGCQRLLEEEDLQRNLRRQRFALICNQASVDKYANHILDKLMEIGLVPSVLMAPEHGIYGEHAYMEPVRESIDERYGIEVISLYGETQESLTPPLERLQDIDAIVFDLQDIGARYYTYLATMALLMETAEKAGISFIVLDRPNPIGLEEIEGNIVSEDFRSFVGYLPVPNRHGLTAGEAAIYWHFKRRLNLDLKVIECKGLKRRDIWPDMALPFVPPSPNIPNWETALVYPGICLFEGTNLSEGRGTPLPFMVLGAPFIRDPFYLAKEINNIGLEGVIFRPLFFTPTADKWANRRCGGVHIIITDHRKYKPLLVGMYIIQTCLRIYPEDFRFRDSPYEFVTDKLAIDLLFGNSWIREALTNNMPVKEIWWTMMAESRLFRSECEEFFLYG